jgi:multidrug efflux pump subunit AcrA (membrane-fusion protein)
MTETRLTLIVVICLSAVASGCQRPQSAASEETVQPRSPLPVNVIVVSNNSEQIRETICYGRITPTERAVLRFAKPGTVQSVQVTAGQLVEAGDELASLDEPTLSSERDELVERISSLETQLQSAPAAQQPALNSQLAQLKQQEQAIVGQLEQSVLRATFDGIVQEVNVAEGDAVSPAVAAIQLVENQQPIVSGQMSTADLLNLQADQSLQVSIDDQMFAARLNSMKEAETDKPNQLIGFTLAFVDPLPREYWLFDEIVEVRATVNRPEESIQLPTSAIQQNDADGWHVLVAETSGKETRLTTVPIEVLDYVAESVLVVGDLKPGDRVVANGTHRVVPGQRVTVSATGDSVNSPASSVGSE